MSTRSRLALKSCILAALSFMLAGLSWMTPALSASEIIPDQRQSPGLRSLYVTLGTKSILAKVADTDSSRIQGLLGWEYISEDTGMLLDFIMEGTYAIHMQGMKFPIDAIWIDSKGVIRLIYDDIQPNSGQIFPSMFPSRYCLEVKSGFCRKFGVKIGQTVSFGQTGPETDTKSSK